MAPTLIRPFSVADAKVKVIEDGTETVFENASIDVLAKTAKLFVPVFDDETGVFTRMRAEDTLRQVRIVPGAGGHRDFVGISDRYRSMGLDGDDAEVTWRVWATPPKEAK